MWLMILSQNSKSWLFLKFRQWKIPGRQWKVLKVNSISKSGDCKPTDRSSWTGAPTGRRLPAVTQILSSLLTFPLLILIFLFLTPVTFIVHYLVKNSFEVEALDSREEQKPQTGRWTSILNNKQIWWKERANLVLAWLSCLILTTYTFELL